MRRALTSCTLLLLTGCSALLGADFFDGHLRGEGSDGDVLDGAVSTDAADGSLDEQDAADSWSALETELAKKRTRIGDVPKSWSVGGARIYALDDVDNVRSLTPPNGPAVDYTFAPATYGARGTQDLLAVGRAAGTTIYRASSLDAELARVDWESDRQFTGTQDALAFWKSAENPSMTELFTFREGDTAPVKLLEFGAQYVTSLERARGNVLYFYVAGNNTAWVVDTANKTSRSFSLPYAPSGLGGGLDGASAGSLVVQHFVGSTVDYVLLADGKSPRELATEVSAVSSVVPEQLRSATGTGFTVIGSWLVYSARGGLLAYHLKDKRLVPVQIRAEVLFVQPSYIEASGLLAFVITSQDAANGLYTVPLADVLPP